ncbi:transmembrane protein 50A [Halictus rubicundus]|uniref:transmembrane protein 50A n=1 Tax=Halictus rubicundus TaxID=77578 RepID=UPI004036E924
MTSCLENFRPSSCVWFELDIKRNVLVSMLAGSLFFIGWWFIIDAHAKYPSEMKNTYHLLGVFGTLSFVMVNSVTNAQIRGDGYNGDNRVARGFLFLGFVMGFATVISASWILFADFIAADVKHHWPGVGLFLQNIFIFIGSLTYKFGIVEEL